MKHFDVGKLTADGQGAGGCAVAGHYIKTVLEKAGELWPVDGVVEEKWQAVSAAISSTGTEVLGTSSRYQPDWFIDALVRLLPLLSNWNRAYAQWLGAGRPEDLVWFRTARRTAHKAIREAKNLWFKDEAAEIQHNHFGEKNVWKCIRDMQRCKRGCIASWVVTIHDEDGVPWCDSISAGNVILLRC